MPYSYQVTRIEKLMIMKFSNYLHTNINVITILY